MSNLPDKDEKSPTYLAYASVGSNICPKQNVIVLLKELLKWEDPELIGISSVYETAPVGMSEDTDNFHNLCIKLRTKRSPEELKSFFRDIEAECGRTRSEDDEVTPRVIDVDILLYEPSPEGFEPHPQVHDEAFVVYPLSELLDPTDFEDLPDSVEEWKVRCDESVILGEVTYEWPEEIRKAL